MAKIISAGLEWTARALKALVGLLLIPPVIGLVIGFREQLAAVPAGPKTYAQWAALGAMTYLGLHLLFYKPLGLFKFQHGLLSKLAQWLFGGQVSTTEGDGGGKRRKTPAKSKAKQNGNGAGGGGESTLLVLSPYLVPLYTLLVCWTVWLVRQWGAPAWLDMATGLLIGATVCMHWAMTADDLQQNRDKFPFDAYLLTLGIIAVVSLLLVSAALPMAVPGFSLQNALTRSFEAAKSIYLTVVEVLFLS